MSLEMNGKESGESEGEDCTLFISYENLFGKFAENYWTLVTKYHLKQMLPDGKSEYSKIEQLFMSLIQEQPSFADIPFTSIPESRRFSIIKQVSSDCRRNVIGALHRDFQDCLYAFDLKGDGIYLNAHAFNFMLKYKVEIEKLNYYAWAKFLEKVNDESVLVKLLDKLELATPQREDLSIFREVLFNEFEQCNCFYCGKKLIEMKYVNLIQNRNEELKKLDSTFVQKQFKTYKPNLIGDMWKYAQSGGFVMM